MSRDDHRGPHGGAPSPSPAGHGGPGADGTHAALVAERAETAARIDALTREFDGIVESAELVATDDEHDPEGHTIAFERQQVAAILREARARLVDIDDALERLHAGSYGRCLRCGAAISAERLAARPATRTCVGCAA